VSVNTSQLPEFVVTRFHIQEPAGSYDMLEVRCPRAGCVDPTFWIRPAWLEIRPTLSLPDGEPAYPVGRNCPSCGRVAAVPEALRFIARPRKARRIVRRSKRKTPV